MRRVSNLIRFEERYKDNMEPDDLRHYLSEVKKCLPHSSGKDLSGMLFDCAYAIEASSLFTKIKAARTGDIDRLLEVHCQTAMSSEEAIQEIEEIWNKELRYQNEPEAHRVTIDEQKIIFNGVTQVTGLYYVTLQIVVTLQGPLVP